MDLDFSRAIDISQAVNENTVVWIEDPQPELRPILRQPEAPVNFTWLDFSAHCGTHIDAPYFLFPDSWTSDQIPLDRALGPAQVIDLTHVDDLITPEDLAECEITQPRVLIRTQNSFDPMREYNPDHVAMTLPCAQWLIDAGARTVGYDYQSFERAGANELHRVLLAERVTIIDNLRLADAPAGEYTLICLPIKVTGIDAAPARAILLPLEK